MIINPQKSLSPTPRAKVEADNVPCNLCFPDVNIFKLKCRPPRISSLN